jgi:hypothetical protein
MQSQTGTATDASGRGRRRADRDSLGSRRPAHVVHPFHRHDATAFLILQKPLRPPRKSSQPPSLVAELGAVVDLIRPRGRARRLQIADARAKGMATMRAAVAAAKADGTRASEIRRSPSLRREARKATGPSPSDYNRLGTAAGRAAPWRFAEVAPDTHETRWRWNLAVSIVRVWQAYEICRQQKSAAAPFATLFLASDEASPEAWREPKPKTEKPSGPRHERRGCC